MEGLFWICLVTLSYAYLGFPLLTFFRSIGKPTPAKTKGPFPSVSICIAAHNEESVIRGKLENIFTCEYPAHKLEIIVASDGSVDKTAAIVKTFRSLGVVLLDLPRSGKNLALNAAVAAATGDILIFTDADVSLEKDAMEKLVSPFGDASVGCVAGDFRYARQSGSNGGEHTYWDFDRKMKEWQMRAGSVTSATGQLYALRRSFYRPLPRGVTDDFVTSVQARIHGKRIVFAGDARSHGIGVDSAKKEFKRKVRVLTAGLKGVWLTRELLNPFHHGYYAWQLFSHKVLRRLAVLPVLGQTLALAFLALNGSTYAWLLILQGAFHAAALAGFFLGKTRLGKLKPLMLPCYFDMLMLATLFALWKLAREHQEDLWSPQRDSQQALSTHPSTIQPST